MHTANAKANGSTGEQIILEHLSLVKSIASRLHETLPRNVELDDLVNGGVLGLFDAVKKYDPKKKVPFRSYAQHRIKGAMLDDLRKLDWASRNLRHRQKQVEAAERRLSTYLQRNPTGSEIAEELGIKVNSYWQVMSNLQGSAAPLSASVRCGDSADLPAPDFPANSDSEPDKVYSREQLCARVDFAMQSLPAKHRKVVSLYYTGEMTMKEIGEVLGIHESRVSQIHKTALAKMQLVLHSSGIHSSKAF